MGLRPLRRGLPLQGAELPPRPRQGGGAGRGRSEGRWRPDPRLWFEEAGGSRAHCHVDVRQELRRMPDREGRVLGVLRIGLGPYLRGNGGDAPRWRHCGRERLLHGLSVRGVGRAGEDSGVARPAGGAEAQGPGPFRSGSRKRVGNAYEALPSIGVVVRGVRGLGMRYAPLSGRFPGIPAGV